VFEIIFSSGILRGVDCWLFKDVSVQPMGPVKNYRSTLRNIPEKRGSHLHDSRSLKLCKFEFLKTFFSRLRTNLHITPKSETGREHIHKCKKC
jgi:hypothetical protein